MSSEYKWLPQDIEMMSKGKIDIYLKRMVKRHEHINGTSGDSTSGSTGTSRKASTPGTPIPDGQLDHTQGKVSSKDYMASMRRSGLFGQTTA